MKLTVITPTYNRVDYLERLYESLKTQKNKNFDWLIIDDGSTDETSLRVKRWINEDSTISINYIFKNNGGKHSAYNLALDTIDSTGWHVVVDSDDWLFSNSIKIFADSIKKVGGAENLPGFVFPRKGGPDHWLSEKVKTTNIPDIKLLFGLKVETCILIRNQAVGDYRFPIIENEKFMGEESLYIHLSSVGEFIALDREVYGFDYLEDGWTKNIFQIWKENPKSTLYSLSERKMYVEENYAGWAKYKNLFKVWMNEEALKFSIESRKITYFKQCTLTKLIFFLLIFVFSKRRFG